LHRENKLRTVVWQFAEKLLQPAEVEQLNELLSQIDRKYLSTYLSEDEIDAIFGRTKNLLQVGRFSSPNPNWPAVPWPPY
jgi:hypothetical protein